MNDFIRLAKENIWSGIIAFLLVFGGLAYLAANASETYRARSLILFTLGREYVYIPETDQSGVKAPNPGDFQGVVNAEMLLLDDPVLRRAAIEAVGLERAYPDIAAATFEDADPVLSPEEAETMRLGMAAGMLRAATSVSVITGSYVVSVTVSHGDPVIAAELANALTDAYFEKRRRIYSEREIRTLRDRLDAAEGQAVELADRIFALLDGGNPVIFENEFESALRTNAAFESDLAAARVELAVLMESLRATESQLDQIEPVTVAHSDFRPDPVHQSRVEQLAVLESEYASAVAQLGSSHPQAVALLGQIERAREVLTEEPGEVTAGRRVGPNPVYTALERQRIETTVAIEEARRRIAYLQEAIDATAAEVVEYSKLMPQLSLLEQGQADQAQRIVSLQSRLRESVALSQTDERDNVRVIQAAVPPTGATTMPLRVRLAIAVVVAGMAAIAVMLILVLLGRRPGPPSRDEPAAVANDPSRRDDGRHGRIAMRSAGG